MRAGWRSGHFVPVASTAAAQELVRALGNPKFGLPAAEREELSADFRRWVEVVRVSDPPPATRACRDPLDLPLLHLDKAGRARAPASGDRDLLALAGSPWLCPVLAIDAFGRRFLDD